LPALDALAGLNLNSKSFHNRRRSVNTKHDAKALNAELAKAAFNQPTSQNVDAQSVYSGVMYSSPRDGNLPSTFPQRFKTPINKLFAGGGNFYN